LANSFILLSTLALGAIAAPSITDHFVWLRRRFGSKPNRVDAATLDRPRLHTEDGWTTIACDNPTAFEAWLGKDEEGLPTRPGEEPSLGSHLLIELYDCDGSMLEREDHVGQAMRDAALMSKATVVEQSFHEFKPYGVSGAVIIQESHYTIHTWPEHGYAAVDLFYCGGSVQVHRAVEVLRERFRPGRIKFLVVRRGIESEVRG
jgi:S-adenosylmethionine decarboxylase